ncbi:hypothetical protein JVT61DRAFT_1183 [Boletus reticuloceps]|uniref:Uncharacterized protein n=1 Tax=Boletus reticuloceps TaxID=495285 RepID=A0A8I2YTK4_9AGAM|nr:hypothetical protein JVT61DRAFT_1183 [Boletus reticuloceps]
MSLRPLSPQPGPLLGCIQVSAYPSLRNKRSYDHAVDDFFADVKKRKVAPESCL